MATTASIISPIFIDLSNTPIPEGSTFVSAVDDGSGNGTFTVTYQPLPDPQGDTVPPVIIGGCIGGHPHRPA